MVAPIPGRSMGPVDAIPNGGRQGPGAVLDGIRQIMRIPPSFLVVLITATGFLQSNPAAINF